VHNLVGTVLAGIICAGWFLLGEGNAAAATGDDQGQAATGALNPQGEKVSQASALYASALSREASGDQAGALTQLRQVLAIDPHFTDAQIKLASLLLEAKQPDAAYAQLQAALANHADPSAVNVVMARVEQARKHGAGAQRLGEAALAHDPTSTDAMRVLLEIGLAQKQLEAATARVTTQLAAAHAPVDSYLALVKLYLDITGKENPQPDGDVVLKTLLNIYQTAVKQGTPRTDVLSVLSDTYRDLDRKPEALATLQSALKIDPDNVDILMRSAGFASNAGDKATAVHNYEKAYALNPTLDGLQASLAGAYYENQQYAKALALMKRMLRDTPDDPMLLIRIGVTSESLHENEQARGWFDKAMKSPAFSLEACLKLAAYFIDQQRAKEAAGVLALGEKHFPDSAQLHFYAAVQAQATGNASAALGEFNQARKLAGDDPSSLGANFYLEGAMILAAAGRHDQASPLLKDGLQKFPDDPNLLNQEAWEWADQGTNLGEAEKTAQHAVDLAPGNGSMMDTLGYVELKAGKGAAALPVLQRAAKMTNNDPSVLQHLGDAYLVVGRKSDALAAWRLALTKDPRNRDLTQRIETNRTPAPHVTSRPASP
jgi:tetratricopeptide (TPR) repeat protein